MIMCFMITIYYYINTQEGFHCHKTSGKRFFQTLSNTSTISEKEVEKKY